MKFLIFLFRWKQVNAILIIYPLWTYLDWRGLLCYALAMRVRKKRTIEEEKQFKKVNHFFANLPKLKDFYLESVDFIKKLKKEQYVPFLFKHQSFCFWEYRMQSEVGFRRTLKKRARSEYLELDRAAKNAEFELIHRNVKSSLFHIIEREVYLFKKYLGEIKSFEVELKLFDKTKIFIVEKGPQPPKTNRIINEWYYLRPTTRENLIKDLFISVKKPEVASTYVLIPMFYSLTKIKQDENVFIRRKTIFGLTFYVFFEEIFWAKIRKFYLLQEQAPLYSLGDLDKRLALRYPP